MAIGNTDTKKNYYVKVLGLKKGSTETVAFQFQTKNPNPTGEEDKYLVQTATEFDGTLVGCKHKTYEHEGETIDQVELTFEDGEERYILRMGVSGFSTQILNSLASQEEFGSVRIALSRRNGYPSAWIENKGEKCDWAYDYKEVIAPLVKVTKVGKKDVVDSSERDEWLINTVIPKINEATATPEANVTTTGEEQTVESTEETTDLPF
jgi:hypothetical protein